MKTKALAKWDQFWVAVLPRCFIAIGQCHRLPKERGRNHFPIW